jgi:hypothetical protein
VERSSKVGLLVYKGKCCEYFLVHLLFSVSFLSCPRVRQVYRIVVLYPPGYSMIAAVLREAINETLCSATKYNLDLSYFMNICYCHSADLLSQMRSVVF